MENVDIAFDISIYIFSIFNFATLFEASNSNRNAMICKKLASIIGKYQMQPYIMYCMCYTDTSGCVSQNKHKISWNRIENNGNTKRTVLCVTTTRQNILYRHRPVKLFKVETTFDLFYLLNTETGIDTIAV